METIFTKQNEKEFERRLTDNLNLWWSELHELLPTLPDTMTYEVEHDPLASGYQVNGNSIRPGLIKLMITDEKKIDELIPEIKEITFHETYHQAQGYSYEALEGKRPSALEIAAWEGAACVFQANYADSTSSAASYDREFIDLWLPQLLELGVDEYYDDWRKWRFHDPETDTDLIMYRVGTYIALEALKNSGNTIIELASLSGQEIIELAELDTV